MYLRYCEARGFATDMIEYQDGEEAGLKSATFAVRGDYAFGYLKSERGVHRLVRISPFDAANKRHTSFASVSVFPEIEEIEEIEEVPAEGVRVALIPCGDSSIELLEPIELLLPLAGLLYAAMTLDSALAHWRGRGGAWKGRVAGGAALERGGNAG